MTQLTNHGDRRLWPASTSYVAVLADYWQLAKPRLTLMVVITTFIGFVMGLRHVAAGQWSYAALLGTLVGTGLSCIGAGVFNQVVERHVDARMRRTMSRPLPAGRMSARHATVIAAIACVTGIALVAIAGGMLSAALALITILGYVLVYTPMKCRSSICTVIGAIPGALPPVIGYSAATGTVGVEASLLFALLFMWQLPHFLAIAFLYRRDYARAGLPMLPVVDGDGRSTFRQILLGSLALLPLGLTPAMAGVSGPTYFVVALVAGLMFLGFAVALAIGRTRRLARALFLASLVYLPIVFTMMWIDQL